MKIQCAVDLDGDGNLDKDSNNKNVDCFDPAVSANGCRNVTVKIIYKFLNSNKDLELEIVNGIYGDKDFSWMAFNQSQVNLQTGTKAIFGNTAENFNIEETINTCEPYLVEIKSKMPVPQIVKEGIWEATDETDDYYPLKLRFCNKQYGQGTNDAANCLNTVLSGQNDLDLSTDKCKYRFFCVLKCYSKSMYSSYHFF